ncbi:MAG: glycerophosphodiester phosphodiesterase family protein [Nitrospirota bacterium]|nr:glycerophosphodiester phosphodiesterase family protein [Nitrospirota bacterium]
MTTPLVVAHRGYQRHYPENTLIALEAALKCGARFLEIDIQLSADGIPVLLHDADLRRTAGRRGRIFSMTMDEIRQVEVNESSRLGNAFSGVPLPTLAEAVDLIRQWPEATLFVEIKEESLKHFGMTRVVEAVMKELGPATGQCIPISFDAPAMRQARELGATVIGWAVGSWGKRDRVTAEALAPQYLFCNYRRLPLAGKPLWQGPWKWVVYEVADPSHALSLANRGIEMIETFAVGEMLNSL